MSTKRQKRIGDTIQEEISDVLRTRVTDPRLQNVTITGAEITPDLRQARVWFSVFGEEDAVKEAFAALEKASGLFRRELGARMRLRFVPELTFKLDTSWQRGARVDSILDQIASETTENKEHEDTAGG